MSLNLSHKGWNISLELKIIDACPNLAVTKSKKEKFVGCDCLLSKYPVMQPTKSLFSGCHWHTHGTSKKQWLLIMSHALNLDLRENTRETVETSYGKVNSLDLSPFR